MAAPHVTLEQWQALVAVVEHGTYARAAEALHKSQSSVTYAVQKLESQLGVKAFEIQGRRAKLTPVGEHLYRRARLLLEEATGLEQLAKTVSAGWEAQVRLAAEIIFPYRLLLRAFERFAAQSPHTRIELIESVIAGTPEALLRGEADLAISAQIPPGFIGEPLVRIEMVAAAHPGHALHRLGRPVTNRDLAKHRQLIVRETAAARPTRPTIDAAQRWTVSNSSTSILAASEGLGWGWFSLPNIQEEIAAGTLKPLPLAHGGTRLVQLHLVYADRDNTGPGTLRLAQLICEAVKANSGSEP